MKKRFRTIVLVLSLALLTAVFASCGGPASPSAAPSSGAISMAVDNSMDAAENNFKGVTIQYASCFNEAEQQAIWLKDMAEQWAKETGGSVNFNFAGRDVLTSVKSDILIGNAPDIIDNDASELIAALLTDQEVLLEPLNDVYARSAYGEDTPIKDNMNGAYMLYTEAGNDYVMPFIYITSGFFYNKTMFAELGLKTPTTWDEFLAVSDSIETSGVPALAADGNISFYNCYYFQALCQRILGSGKFLEAALDKTGASWNDPGFLQAAKMLSEISAAGKNYFQDGYAGSAYPAAQSDWAMGGAGMIYCGTWIPLETASLTEDDFEFGFFPFPTVEGGAGELNDIEAQLMSFSVPRDAKNKDAAKDFIAFCSSKAAADRLVELSDNMAARTDAIYPDALIDVKPTVDNATAYHKNFDGAMSAAPEWWANVFYPADDGLFFGELSPEAFIEQMKTETVKFYENKQ